MSKKKNRKTKIVLIIFRFCNADHINLDFDLLLFTAIDLCSPNPCLNGQCANLIMNESVVYMCTCDPGWTGKLCDDG